MKHPSPGRSGLRVLIPFVGPEVVTEAVRNMSQINEGQRAGPVVAGYGYFQGIDTVNAPGAACGGPGALVNHHPGRGRGRSTPPPRLTRRFKASSEQFLQLSTRA